MQVCYLPYERGGPYPGLFLFTQAARLMRPVRQVLSRQQELVGALEQSTMHIRCGLFTTSAFLITHDVLWRRAADDDVAHLLTG